MTDTSQSFAAWTEKHGITSEILPIRQTVLNWTRYCSPPGAHDDSLLIACADIAVWLFYLDDYGGADLEQLLDAYLDVLDQKEIPNHHPHIKVLRACEDVVEMLRRRDLPLTNYREGRRWCIGQFRERRRMMSQPSTTTFDTYLELRRATNYFFQWSELWGLLEGFIADEPDQDEGDVTPLVSLVNDWHIYRNEIVSIDRDDASGTPNLVNILARDLGLSRQDAIVRLTERRDHVRSEFHRQWQDVASGEPSPRIVRHLEFLRISMLGGDDNYAAENPRYDARSD